MLSANQIEDIQLQAFCGEPSILTGVCNVYPLKISEIARLGYNKFQYYLGVLLLTPQNIKEKIKEKTKGNIDTLEDITTLEYLLLSAEQNDMFFLELQDMLTTFIKEEIVLLPKINAILVGSPEDKRLITTKNFEDFQNILRVQNKIEVEKPPPENETPWERQKRENAEKIAKIKRKKAEKEGKKQSLEAMLEIAEVYGINYENKTLYAFYGLLSRHQAHEKWQNDLQAVCAGADSKQMKIKYWGESSKDD